MNQKIIELELKHYQLKERQKYLRQYKKNLEEMVEQITTARTFQVWQKITRARDSILRKPTFTSPMVGSSLYATGSGGLTGILKSQLRKILPYSTRLAIKKNLAKLDSGTREFNIYKHALEKATHSERKIEPLTDSVSIVIPTMNAGPHFEVILKKIISQKGVPKLELIIIDSGSSDETLQLAKEYGAKIIKIKASEFSHSRTRNQAAQVATGKYLIFTVQDAYLMNEYTVYDLVTLLQKTKAVAGSGRQIPRADADIFAAWQIKEFVNMISPPQEDMAVSVEPKKFAQLPLEKQRALCTIDDVFSIYDLAIFHRLGGYDEALGYGEDLEMGKRLIEQNYKIAFLFSNGVIHSHTRPASYVLKRYFTDSKFLYTVFHSRPAINANHSVSLETQLQHFLVLGEALAAKVKKIDRFAQSKLSMADVRERVNQKSDSGYHACQLLSKLITELGYTSELKHLDEKLTKSLVDQLNFYIQYAEGFMNNYFNFEERSSSELQDLFDKIFAVFVSGLLTQYYFHDQESADAQKLDQFLESGV